MIQPYNYSSKFIERCERFMGSVEKLLARLESNEYAEKDPAFKGKIQRLVEMKEEIDSGKFSEDEEADMLGEIRKGAEEIYGRRFGDGTKVLGEKDFTKEEKDKLLSQARANTLEAAKDLSPTGKLGGKIYDDPEITKNYITDKDGMFKGIGLDTLGVFSSNKDKLITDDGRLAFAEGKEPETVDMKKEHEEAWKDNQWLYGLGGLIREAQKFMLPLEGDVGFDLSNYDGMEPLVRSPYKNIVLEYPTTKMFETDPERGVDYDFTGNGLHGGCMIVVDEHVYKKGTEEEELFWSMIPIAFNKAHSSWWCEKIVYQLRLNEGGDFDSFIDLRYYFADWSDGFNLKDIDFDSLDDVRKTYLEHMGTLCAEVFVDFAIANNTKNIKKTTIYPAKKLNAKRIANGKRPLFEYKILDIHREAIEFNRPMLSAGTGSKKRQHMCKGHFKKRKTGVYWWNPQVRGSKELGVVKKDYKLTA